ncbi:MAG: cytochrome o ubiquinol oxidase subunit III, partial [Candidatus Saccharimonadales bacterium]
RCGGCQDGGYVKREEAIRMSELTTIQPGDHAKHADSKALLGFWVYLMTDCVLFASLFATYAVLRNNTYGGPPASDLFHLPMVLVSTLILLVSSFTCGLAVIAARRNRKQQVVFWMLVTMALGLTFLSLEISEFRQLASEGNNWQRSGFLSGFFTLVGTHGLHITVGILWMAILAWSILRKGLVRANLRRLAMLSYFWHFLDVVWIFIFTIVYLMGTIKL